MLVEYLISHEHKLVALNDNHLAIMTSCLHYSIASSINTDFCAIMAGPYRQYLLSMLGFVHVLVFYVDQYLHK